MPFLSIDAVKFGSVFEMLILSYAITYRVKILKEENELYKENIKKYLDKIYVLQNSVGEENEIDETALKEKFNLSIRELEVLQLIYKGYINKKIAETLFISTNTVKYHIKNIYDKLEIRSKKEVVHIISEIQNT